MPDPQPPAGAASPSGRDQGGETAWQRRRRLEQVFGDVLPETTADERDGAGAADRSGDDWLTAQVPPHHG